MANKQEKKLLTCKQPSKRQLETTVRWMEKENEKKKDSGMLGLGTVEVLGLGTVGMLGLG